MPRIPLTCTEWLCIKWVRCNKNILHDIHCHRFLQFAALSRHEEALYRDCASLDKGSLWYRLPRKKNIIWHLHSLEQCRQGRGAMVRAYSALNYFRCLSCRFNHRFVQVLQKKMMFLTSQRWDILSRSWNGTRMNRYKDKWGKCKKVGWDVLISGYKTFTLFIFVLFIFYARFWTFGTIILSCKIISNLLFSVSSHVFLDLKY